MRNKDNIKLSMIIFGIVLALSTINYFKIGHVQETSSIQDETDLKDLKTSGFWTTNFIHVDGNWSDTALTYDWCSGDGSWGNPYTIENVTIDGISSPTGQGIFINNSKIDYFMIKYCTISNADNGIILKNTENGILINNTCSGNTRGIQLNTNCNNNSIFNNTAEMNLDMGITLSIDCNNNTLSGNTAYVSGGSGIYLYYGCDGNNISGNTAYVSGGSGIHLYNDCDGNNVSGNTAYTNGGAGIHLNNGCDGNNISGNTVYENIDYGILLDSNCHNNTISGNTANNNTFGLYLYANCDNNTISGNTAYNNGDYGIYLYDGCDDNIIMENTMHYNHQYGLIIDSLCYNNLIYLNDFKNQFNARDDGNNQWDNGAIGNHWDDYEGVDANDDGIGDSPYNISGSAGSQDNFPIWEDGIDIRLLYAGLFDQVFSTADFNITFYVYNGFNEGIDFASIQLWWDDTEVSSSVQNLGGGFYFVSLDPITVASGEDPILLKMSIYADGYEDLYYETYIAVDPIVIQKYDEHNGVPITPTWMVLMIFLWIFGVPVGIIVLIIYLNKKRKRPHI